MIREPVQTCGNNEAENVLLWIGETIERDALRELRERIECASGKEVFLILFPVSDWDTELSPWPALPAFGKEPFKGGARETLERTQKWILPEVKGKRIYIGGYSLAGLFALWAAYETEAFYGVNAASPSVWYPDWLRYIEQRRIRAEKVYLSLGDREEKTRNPVLSRVGSCIRQQYENFLSDGVPAVLEWNKGNHFQDAQERTIQGFLKLLLM